MSVAQPIPAVRGLLAAVPTALLVEELRRRPVADLAGYPAGALAAELRRRKLPAPSPVAPTEGVDLPGLRYDAETRVVEADGRAPVRLSPTEARVLVALASSSPRWVRCDRLALAVWPRWGVREATANLRTVVCYLRVRRGLGALIEGTGSRGPAFGAYRLVPPARVGRAA